MKQQSPTIQIIGFRYTRWRAVSWFVVRGSWFGAAYRQGTAAMRRAMSSTSPSAVKPMLSTSTTPESSA